MVSGLHNKNIAFSPTIAQDFDINYTTKINEFSTEFATAHPASTRIPTAEKVEYYALVFNKSFPADLNKINIYKTIREKSLQELTDFGRVQTNKGEALCCILKKPTGIKLSEAIKKARFDEQLVTGHIFNQLFAGSGMMHANGIMHGNINLDSVYYNQKDNSIIIKEPISEFTGFSQRAAYETFERMVCDQAGKSHRDIPADLYACGVLMASLITGRDAFSETPDDLVKKSKLENGSYDAIFGIPSIKNAVTVSQKTESLIKGLLHDKSKERWQAKQISGWQKKESANPLSSRLHKQASSAFTFEGIDYYSPKYLAYTLQQNWMAAKKNLKLVDLTRWISFISRAPDIEKRLAMMTRGGHEVILPDDKLARIIYMLDDDGPIRYKDVSFHPDGLGNLFAYHMSKNNTSAIESISAVIDSGFIESWISGQENTEIYKPNIMGWSPKKIKSFIRRNEPGFGAERCLYEMNPYLPCLSPILENIYAITLHSVLTALNQGRMNGKDIDNDKHLTSYICFHTEIDDSIKIKSLQNFPYFSRSLPIKYTAMFALAQRKSGIDKLPGIANWLRQSLIQVTDKLNSDKIKKNVIDDLDTAAITGDISKMFAIISDPKSIRSDVYGFQEARKQYKILTFEILKLKSQHNLDQLAYRMGLRVAVILSYLICAIAIMSVAFMNF